MRNVINFFDPGRNNKKIESLVVDSIRDVIKSGEYVLGQRVRDFEKKFSDYLNAKYCVGVASGTDAITIALLAAGIKAGDEVITPSFTATATASAVVAVGAIPVFIDISPNDYNLDYSLIEKLLTAKTKAVLAVHLYGNPCQLDSITKICNENGLTLIEDCAQATGATFNDLKVGTFGHLSCFSFYPTKNLACIGDGGAIVTSDPELYQRALKIRQYGWNINRESVSIGRLSRLDEIQAAVLTLKLDFLESDNDKRLLISKYYDDSITGSNCTRREIKANSKSSNHLYVLEVENRSKIQEKFLEIGINLGIHYEYPAHMQSFFRQNFKFDSMSLSYTESRSRSVISIPLYPELTDSEIERISCGLREIL